MSALILKRLRQSELGWFRSVREQGRETGRQRGLNIDVNVLVQVFGRLPERTLPLVTRYFDGERMVEDHRPLRHQQKNWRLTGEAVRGRHFDDVRPDDVVLMLVERRDSGTDEPAWMVTWDRVSQHDRNTFSLHEMCGRQLRGESSVLSGGPAAEHILQVARRRLRAFGAPALPHFTGDLHDEDWDRGLKWLLQHLDAAELNVLAESCARDDVPHVLGLLGDTFTEPGPGELAELVLRRFGPDLLADPKRRALIELAAARRGATAAAPNRWHRGGETAHAFVQAIGLPSVFAGQEVERPQDFEDITAFKTLGALHEYQQQLAEGIRDVISAGTWEKRRAIAWLPTGTGKTRVMVETLLMECVLDAPRNAILWIADRDELCEQAVETFRHVWMVRGEASRTAKRGVVPTLRVVRLWGSRDWQDLPDWPTVVVASVQTLAQRLEKESWRELLAILGERAAAVVFDEAHHLVAPSWGRVVEALGLSRTYNYLQRNQTTAPPLFGLTATPARSSRDETEELSRRFQGRLLEPAQEWRSFSRFQQDGFLSYLKIEDIKTGYTLELTEDETRQLSLWQQIPKSALKRAGTDAARTARIIRDLESRLGSLRSVLVFACSVEHAHTIADVLEHRGWRAAALDGTTSRAVRWQTIQRFRRGELQVLVNYDLLATGFDAPNVDAVAIARPVASKVLYAQMIGRGLRGPKNGGTRTCLLLDYRDDLRDLPDLESLRVSFRDEYLRSAGME